MDGETKDYPRAAAPTCSVVGFLLGLAAASCFVFITVTPCWYVSYAEATISPYENCYGLWKFCSSTGLCDKWLAGSLLGPHGVQRVVCRGLMITACLLSAPALVLNVFGMKCVFLFHLSSKTKEKLTRWSAVLWITSGTFSCVSSTWYALDVINSAWEKGEVVELSDGIFTGWGSVVFAYTASVFLWVAATIWRRERKSAARRRDSMLTSVVAAYVASSNNSGARVGCGCHLPPKLLTTHGCTPHENADAKIRRPQRAPKYVAARSPINPKSSNMTYV